MMILKKKKIIGLSSLVLLVSISIFGSGCDKETDIEKEEAAIKAYLDEHIADFHELQPLLTNNDIDGNHILVTNHRGEYHYSGFIDFGDSDCGELEYELVKIHIDAFRCDADLTNAMLREYRKLRPIDFSLAKCKLYSILHRCSTLDDFLDWEKIRRNPDSTAP